MDSVEEKIFVDFEEKSRSSPSESAREVPHFDVESTHEANPTLLRKIWIRSIRILYVVLFKEKICMMLSFGPLALLLHYLTGNQGIVFLFGLLSMIPLDDRLSYATEQLALHTGPTVGGLLNAIFSNTTVMIISIYALKNGLIRVVQQSLLGSILSNMLLVLGCAFFTGGLVHYKKFQVFNKASAVVNSGLLLVTVMGILFPTVLHFTHSEVHFGKSELSLSKFASCIMLVAYASYLFFQLRTQHNHFSPIEEEVDSSENDEKEEIELTQWEAIGWLAILTIWVYILSRCVVDAIQGAHESLNMPVAFICVILLPILANVAKLKSAIMFAMNDKLDITLKIAIGSSTQISMFMIPFCVVFSWCIGSEMDLNLQLFETATLFISVLVVVFMLQEGASNYFKGLMLILCYLIVAASFFVHVDLTHGAE